MGCNRRAFLRQATGAAAVVSLGPAMPTLLMRSALAMGSAGRSNPRALVVIQLTGGNDGLNAVVPYADGQYARLRPTIRVSPKEVCKIDEQLGMHPSLQAFWRLQQEGKLSVVQGVGYPNPNSDHPTSMRIWHTGQPQDAGCQTGWLGRAVDRVYRPKNGEVPATCVGMTRLPLGLNAAKATIPTVHSAGELVLRGAGEVSLRAVEDKVGSEGDGNLALEFVERVALAAQADSRKIEAVSRASGGRGYPSLELAGRLQTIADLVRADVGIRIYFTELGGEGFGGFDNHANQAENHGALLKQLSESVAAFAADLEHDGLLDRVLVMTFSEFGRTVRENGRRGTDHGAAAAMFLVGGKLQSGLVGRHPSLADLEPNGGLKHGIDFRRVYATILERWLECPSQPVLGQGFEAMELFRG